MSSMHCFVIIVPFLFAFQANISSATLLPAANKVADARLFPFEQIQLTDGVVSNFAAQGVKDAEDFRFGNLDEMRERRSSARKCKIYPGDIGWPSEEKWAQFNELLGGALIRTVPEASVCYKDTTITNSSECETLTANWGNSSLRIEDPTSIRSILFQGMTCMPPSLNGYFLGNEPSCAVGGYPEYTVNATNVAQIQLSVNFARENDIRLVIKNTGHDFGAKSTGKGALSIWTHHLKDMDFYEDYGHENWTGAAVKLGAGVQAWEATSLAKQHNITIVGGEGKTVGMMGGYIQGGGHSPLTSILGMAADQILSMQLITPDGSFREANPTNREDLFWAVSGGGGSTFGVITSMVLKAYPRMKVTTMRYNITTSKEFTHDKFWDAQKAYVDDFEKYADLGYYSYFRIRHVGTEIFSDMTSWIAPNTSEVDFRKSIAPMVEKWKAIGVPFDPEIREYDNYPDAWTDAFPQETWTIQMRQASRFFPRDSLSNESRRNESFSAVRGVFEEGANLIMFNMRNPPGSEDIDNAVNPAWRKVIMFAIMFVTWNSTTSTEIATKLSRNLTYEWNPRWIKLTPGSGTYMSESDYIEPDWQHSFHGAKYDQLYKIKKDWDPTGVFYAQNAVGSEEWEMSELLLGHLPSQNSKLCRR